MTTRAGVPSLLTAVLVLAACSGGSGTDTSGAGDVSVATEDPEQGSSAAPAEDGTREPPALDPRDAPVRCLAVDDLEPPDGASWASTDLPGRYSVVDRSALHLPPVPVGDAPVDDRVLPVSGAAEREWVREVLAERRPQEATEWADGEQSQVLDRMDAVVEVLGERGGGWWFDPVGADRVVGHLPRTDLAAARSVAREVLRPEELAVLRFEEVAVPTADLRALEGGLRFLQRETPGSGVQELARAGFVDHVVNDWLNAWVVEVRQGSCDDMAAFLAGLFADRWERLAPAVLLLESAPAFPTVPDQPSACDDARTLLVADDGTRLCVVADRRLQVSARLEEPTEAGRPDRVVVEVVNRSDERHVLAQYPELGWGAAVLVRAPCGFGPDGDFACAAIGLPPLPLPVDGEQRLDLAVTPAPSAGAAAEVGGRLLVLVPSDRDSEGVLLLWCAADPAPG